LTIATLSVGPFEIDLDFKYMVVVSRPLFFVLIENEITLRTVTVEESVGAKSIELSQGCRDTG